MAKEELLEFDGTVTEVLPNNSSRDWASQRMGKPLRRR